MLCYFYISNTFLLHGMRSGMALINEYDDDDDSLTHSLAEPGQRRS